MGDNGLTMYAGLIAFLFPGVLGLDPKCSLPFESSHGLADLKADIVESKRVMGVSYFNRIHHAQIRFV